MKIKFDQAKLILTESFAIGFEMGLGTFDKDYKPDTIKILDDSGDVWGLFEKSDNEFVTIEGSSMFLEDSDNEEYQITILKEVNCVVLLNTLSV